MAVDSLRDISVCWILRVLPALHLKERVVLCVEPGDHHGLDPNLIVEVAPCHMAVEVWPLILCCCFPLSCW